MEYFVMSFLHLLQYMPLNLFPMSLSDFLENVITVLLLENVLNCTRSSVHKVMCNIQLIFYAIYILKALWLKVTVANNSLVTNNYVIWVKI